MGICRAAVGIVMLFGCSKPRPEPTPDETRKTFHGMEDKLVQARTILIEYSASYEYGGKHYSPKGTIHFGPGNKTRSDVLPAPRGGASWQMGEEDLKQDLGESKEEFEARIKKIRESGGPEISIKSVAVQSDRKAVEENCVPSDRIEVKIMLAGDGETLFVCVIPGKELKVAGFKN